MRRPGESFVWKVTVTSAEGSKAPTADGFEVFVKGTRRSFVKFVAPARNVGRSLLALDRDLWIYLPDAGRPVRIPLAQRLVGQVANGDLARVDYAGDYDVTLIGAETVEGVRLSRAGPQGQDQGRHLRRHQVLGGPRRAASGEGGVLRGHRDAAQDRQLRSAQGRRRATPRRRGSRFVDAIRKDRTSVMDFGEVKVRDLPDKYFDKNYMKTLD